jgi:hypothetical protein
VLQAPPEKLQIKSLPLAAKEKNDGFKTERNRGTDTLTQDKNSGREKPGWEMHQCSKCPGNPDMVRKRVGICLNIMAKKDGIDKYDVSALVCFKCNLGFASKNKYIFYCEQCDNKIHPEGDC